MPRVPTPIALGDLLFIWNEKGKITCFRARDGSTVWQESVGGRFYGSPVCVAGRLYAISRKGELVVVSASEKYELLARNPLGEQSDATPAVSGGVMYLRTKSHLISIGRGLALQRKISPQRTRRTQRTAGGRGTAELRRASATARAKGVRRTRRSPRPLR